MFETSKGPKGGGFDKEQTSYRFVLGNGDVIPGLEEGIKGMKAGGVRQIVVPPEVRYFKLFFFPFENVLLVYADGVRDGGM